MGWTWKSGFWGWFWGVWFEVCFLAGVLDLGLVWCFVVETVGFDCYRRVVLILL